MGCIISRSSEEGEMSSCSPAASAAVLDDDDLLSEILLRLPPQPSSLPRASAVCKRWRSLASDPAFSRRFRRHHRYNPPLLGCFMKDAASKFRFEPTLDPPNSVPRARFFFPIDARDCDFIFLGCRHGFLLLLLSSQGDLRLLVWDPASGHEHPLAIPLKMGKKTLIHGAVLRAALGDINHFQVVLVSTDVVEQRVIACVYSSGTGIWGNVISTPLPPNVSSRFPGAIDPSIPAVLVGDSIYMLFLDKSSGIVEFNVDKHSLAVIPLPVGLHSDSSGHCSVVRADGGGLGFLFLSMSDCSAQSWKRTTDSDGIASWVLGRTIELYNLLSPGFQNHWGMHIQGFAEENNVVFLWAFGSDYMVQLDSLQYKKLPEIDLPYRHPLECVYAAGI